MTQIDTRFLTVRPVTFKEKCGDCASLVQADRGFGGSRATSTVWMCGLRPCSRPGIKPQPFEYCIDSRDEGQACGPDAALWVKR